jgi:hypothetical protein
MTSLKHLQAKDEANKAVVLFKGTIKINGVSSPLVMTWWAGD